ncbi:MAG TPA: hypothetical protein VHB21_16395, partial [Minicystis sp.]|nr:hypothetical protein [Minicystis sp.]
GGPAGGGASVGGGAGTSAGGGPACAPNHDGVITRAEVPIEAGLSAKFETATNVTFATSGTAKPDGTRDWNMVGPFSGDHLDLVETIPMSGQWFEPDFAGATYAAKLSDTSDLLGVFEVTADALLLRGVVSPQGGVQKTELTYDPPVAALQFPLSVGASWSANSTVTGFAQGVYSAYTENYSNSVDASGTLEAPFGTFDVLRVKTTLTRVVGGIPTVVRSFGFAAECFGTVATVVSQNDETEDEFSSAAELKRLAP